jgi:hypothetical protein
MPQCGDWVLSGTTLGVHDGVLSGSGFTISFRCLGAPLPLRSSALIVRFSTGSTLGGTAAVARALSLAGAASSAKPLSAACRKETGNAEGGQLAA